LEKDVVFKKHIKALEFTPQSIEDGEPTFRERYLIISKSHLFLFNVYFDNTKLIARTVLTVPQKTKIVMPKDCTKDTGCIILKGKIFHQGYKDGLESLYLFYQFVEEKINQ
jgi:hypothetical protein